MKKLHLVIFVCAFVLLIQIKSVADFSDDFEDGVINSTLWVVGGSQLPPDNYYVWQFSWEEIVDSTDGYLSERVWGPPSARTYGGGVWIRTTHNFNDGKSWLINFAWEADVAIQRHVDMYFIQITDGYVREPADYTWCWTLKDTEPDPYLKYTKNFLTHSHPYHGELAGTFLEYGQTKRSQSIIISPDGIAQYYDGPDGTGNMLKEVQLELDDPDKKWYLRFMVIDATSQADPLGIGGDDRLNLYDFSASIIPVQVGVDIKPGSYPNAVNINGKGVIPVAILGSADLDVTQIDVSTLNFEGASVRVKGNGSPQCSIEDVSGNFTIPEGTPDGYPDLVCQFVDYTEDWLEGDAIATLTGELIDGTFIKGSDSIKIVP